MTAVDASELVMPAFHDVLGDVMAHGHTHYWLHGERGSTKSSFVSVAIVLLVLAKPETNAVVVRRFSNTLRDSVFEQVQWAIAGLGLGRWFRTRVSPMELTYLPTGQRIVFRGADDPLKLKGPKFGRGYAAVVWFEELDQFDGIDAVRSILNSLRRGGDDFWIFYTYNPPRTLWSWVNREELERERRADTLVRRSSYLDVVGTHPEWLGAPFVEEAECLRDVDERAWRSEYLGEVMGSGDSVFGNVVGRRLTDAQCRCFSRTRNGVDWGVVPRPVAIRAVRVGAQGAAAVPVPGALGEPQDAGRDRGHGSRGADVRGRARRGPLSARRTDMGGRHAGRKAVDGGVAARAGAEGASRQEEQHEAPELRVAGRAEGDRDRPGAAPARLRGVQAEGVRARPRRHLGGRNPGRERPQHRRGEVCRHGRRAEGA